LNAAYVGAEEMCTGNCNEFQIKGELIKKNIIIIIIIIIASQHSDMVSDEQKLVLSENEVVPY